jgi:hypothetical protein
VSSALKKEWIVLYDSERNEVKRPDALRSQPPEVQQQWEEEYFRPLEAAIKASGGAPHSRGPVMAAERAGKVAERTEFEASFLSAHGERA